MERRVDVFEAGVAEHKLHDFLTSQRTDMKTLDIGSVYVIFLYQPMKHDVMRRRVDTMCPIQW